MTVLYEDNHIIAVSKTCNEIVQGDKTGDEPLLETVKRYIKEKYNKPGEVFLGVTHRLDRPTSGVVLFARTSKALSRLNDMFRQKSQSINSHVSGASIATQVAHQSIIEKVYWAIVEKQPAEPEGRLENYLIRNEKLNKSFVVQQPSRSNRREATNAKQSSQLAILTYKTLAVGERYTLLEIHLETGRHHQIRCQLAAIGCPIKGDLKYGAKRSNPDGGICLHARQIAFEHPVSHEYICITAPVPEDNLWHALTSSLPSRLVPSLCTAREGHDRFDSSL